MAQITVTNYTDKELKALTRIVELKNQELPEDSQLTIESFVLNSFQDALASWVKEYYVVEIEGLENLEDLSSKFADLPSDKQQQILDILEI